MLLYNLKRIITLISYQIDLLESYLNLGHLLQKKKLIEEIPLN
jgi:hypothetical protein